MSCGYPENNEVKTTYNISCFDSGYFLKKYKIEHAYKYSDAIVYASKDSKISKESYPHFSVGLFSSDVADISYMLRNSYMKLNADSPPYKLSGFDVLSNEFLKKQVSAMNIISMICMMVMICWRAFSQITQQML
ncbi:MAG: hypothetical protein KKH70_03105 [Gammaproteobacteria bacterium]|nr:hypothetical protein [Gammaproteobacteria bacterium]